MSGGSFNYMYQRIEDEYSGQMQDIEMNNMIKDLVIVLKSLEWYVSGDTDIEDYKKDLLEFKSKWFDKSEVRVEKIIEEETNRLKENLLASFEYLKKG